MKWYENVVVTCMGIQPGERVLLITDQALSREQKMLAKTIKEAQAGELVQWTLPQSLRPLTTAPDEILDIARSFDVGIQFLAQTSVEEQPYRLSLLKAAAENSRMRFASGLNIDQAILRHELMADYNKIAEVTYKLKELLTGRNQIHITSPDGTDLSLSILGRSIAIDPGIIREPGYYNLPAGECYVAPIENSANGILVIDKSFPGILVKQPIRLTFQEGRVLQIEGGKEAQQLEKLIQEGEKKPHGTGCRVVAELGIGTNPQARITGNIMTDEKVMGTIHIAIGHNAVSPYNGQNHAPIHLDGVMGSPTLMVDGEMLIDNGHYLI
jgi:leucyl aminopeptidase (aminopeptidase T)